ncbi:hypothetical protein AAF712_008347 [Marasmius tenuissimus]|uniref:Chromo shadow domain-containing protein n=1 Tax=Marasmius tenuissimus TaxID=585030 RepID=A0ABR2ZV09_9AGAR|nr:hypothetical protein PM082_001899 [Marasmius tenuissimus]KAJ8095635.1 hypothetical protein PM082_023042 [Marasmius tenuissimus]KAJ8096056.1 hypothetical protein PM082_022670 [Marasmius tenuissimus]
MNFSATLEDDTVYEFDFLKSNFGHYVTWDDIVDNVEYIERARTDNGPRDIVYVQLNERARRVHACLPLKVARLRLPQKLIQYYEERSLSTIVYRDYDDGPSQTQK